MELANPALGVSRALLLVKRFCLTWGKKGNKICLSMDPAHTSHATQQDLDLYIEFTV